MEPSTRTPWEQPLMTLINFWGVTTQNWPEPHAGEVDQYLHYCLHFFLYFLWLISLLTGFFQPVGYLDFFAVMRSICHTQKRMVWRIFQHWRWVFPAFFWTAHHIDSLRWWTAPDLDFSKRTHETYEGHASSSRVGLHIQLSGHAEHAE